MPSPAQAGSTGKVDPETNSQLNPRALRTTVHRTREKLNKALALQFGQMAIKVVSQMAKTLRRGKVLIDWSQNSDFKTTVCVYAVRAKREEPFISLPITWEELAKAVKRGDEKLLFFSPDAAVKRIKRLGNLFEPVLKLKQKLPSQFTKAFFLAAQSKEG